MNFNVKRGLAMLIRLLIVASFIAPTVINADEIDDLKLKMQRQKQFMKPELIEKVQQLSPETKMGMMSMMALHNRFSKQATFRQVMLEMLSDYQAIAMGILTDSAEMTISAAKRLSNHRIPKGGMLAYIGLENINDDKMAVLRGFGELSDTNTEKLINAVKANNMASAALALGEIGAGCANCHGVFRELPGKSKWLKDN